MSDRRPSKLYVKGTLMGFKDNTDIGVQFREASPADVLAVVRSWVESGTIEGEVVEDECPWCAGDGCWEESNPLPGYSPGPAPMTCPYCKGVGRVLVIPRSTEGET